jgi:phosphoribosylanthranilate isomerase
MTAPHIKICGVTQPQDAALVASAGADYLGINFWPQSKRYVATADALALSRAARALGSVQIVGVFVNASAHDIARAVRSAELDIVQLHGDESPEQAAAISALTGRPVWKALAADRLATAAAYRCHAILVDTPSAARGGTGATFDWSLAAEAVRSMPHMHWVLAGGLTPENVAAAIAVVRPWAVDVASGVELATTLASAQTEHAGHAGHGQAGHGQAGHGQARAQDQGAGRKDYGKVVAFVRAVRSCARAQ